MEKYNRYQFYADDDLDEKIQNYMKNTGHKESRACKELIKLGYRLWESQQENNDEELSIREMLEIVMKVGVKSYIFSQFSASRNIEKNNDLDGIPYKLPEVTRQVDERANSAYESMIEKKIAEKSST